MIRVFEVSRVEEVRKVEEAVESELYVILSDGELNRSMPQWRHQWAH